MAKKTEKELEIQRLDKKTPLQMFRDYVMITVASFIYAVSVSMFLDPNSLAPGGITGIAIILNRLFGIETGTWMLLINIPILLIGIWKFGLRFILSTIYCTAMTSLFTNLLTPVGAVTTDPLLASLAGSALMAVSMVQGRIQYGRYRYYYQAAAVEVPVPQDGSIVFPDRCGYRHSIGVCIPEH